MNWKFLIGIVIGFLFAVVLYFFRFAIVHYGVAFGIGILASITLIIVIGLVVYLTYKDKFLVSVRPKNDNQEEDAQKSILKTVLPNLGEREIENVRSTLQNFLAYRSVFLSLNMAISLIIIIGGLIGTLLLIEQNNLLGSQLEKLETQNQSIDHQNELINTQTLAVDAQTTLFKNQNELIESQNNKIGEQTEFIRKQSEFSENEYYLAQYDQYRQELSNTDLSSRYRSFLFNKIIDLINEGKIKSRSVYADFSLIDFQGINLIGKTLTGFQFRSSSFSGAILKNIIFKNCYFESCIFYNTTFDDIQFINCELVENRFSLGPSGSSLKSDLGSLAQSTKGFQPDKFKGKILFNPSSNLDHNNLRFQDLTSVEIDWNSIKDEDVKKFHFFGSFIKLGAEVSSSKRELLRQFGAMSSEKDKLIVIGIMENDYAQYLKHQRIKNIMEWIQNFEF
ncbi:pentapeptide repeat-containing protein [Flavilitoribacter nigricans]|uniref:Pentapeptide repeat-containing protein n=1 Tax=Flavilitoribacter nigricans (strain ATCC 23147 / DSM 23189 / NBRC 102662 / NCIMB 1420 / SS-2) TaxID=1122177 RepID=A0A2D0MWL4_FLAN2|nr:pentapeptide repeat-containing protein [Flavilitoribacter nigricans]PHN00597.1 hypothetical protein CRP01_41395 [Flavilitoribacter nigricans DSM 23189 = NBRC 102662]